MGHRPGTMWDVIVTHPSNDDYRDGWERTFGKKPEPEPSETDNPIRKIYGEGREQEVHPDGDDGRHQPECDHGFTMAQIGPKNFQCQGCGSVFGAIRPPLKDSAICAQHGHEPCDAGWCKRCGHEV